MKPMISKLLVVLILGVLSASPMHAMEPDNQLANNDVNMLGVPLSAGSLSVLQKRDKDVADAKAQKELAAKVADLKSNADSKKNFQNKKYWMNIAKLSGFATLVSALGAWWYFKKK